MEAQRVLTMQCHHTISYGPCVLGVCVFKSSLRFISVPSFEVQDALAGDVCNNLA